MHIFKHKGGWVNLEHVTHVEAWSNSVAVYLTVAESNPNWPTENVGDRPLVQQRIDFEGDDRERLLFTLNALEEIHRTALVEQLEAAWAKRKEKK